MSLEQGISFLQQREDQIRSGEYFPPAKYAEYRPLNQSLVRKLQSLARAKRNEERQKLYYKGIRQQVRSFGEVLY